MGSLPFPVPYLATSSSYTALASGSSVLLSPHSGTSDPTSSNPPADVKTHTTSLIRNIAISPDEKHIAAITDDKQLKVYSTPDLELLSSRPLSKRGAHLTFSPSGDVIVTDKVGDVYLYPLEPRQVAEEDRPSTGALTSDPSKNVDADLLLGHVSLITTHLLTPDGCQIVTADRDEHIRISRFPQSFVIEKYLFGSEGFVSALYIPQTRPTWLISGGGEPFLRIWDLGTARQIGTVDVSSVLPYRTVRSTIRKTRKGAKRKLDESDPFYTPPVDYMLPSGQGIVVKKIISVRSVDAETILFYSQGCSALHSFTLPSDPSGVSKVNSYPTKYPILDFSLLPSNQILLSLDKAWGRLRENRTPSNMQGTMKDISLSDEEVKEIKSPLAIVQLSETGEMSDITASASNSGSFEPITKLISERGIVGEPSTIAQIDHYSEMSLYPRWPGFEEDDDLAGPSTAAEGPAPAARSTSTGTKPGSSSHLMYPGSVGINESDATRTWTREELEKLSPKELGRLKGKGVNVREVLHKKRKMQKGVPGKRLDLEEEPSAEKSDS